MSHGQPSLLIVLVAIFRKRTAAKLRIYMRGMGSAALIKGHQKRGERNGKQRNNPLMNKESRFRPAGNRAISKLSSPVVSLGLPEVSHTLGSS